MSNKQDIVFEAGDTVETNQCEVDIEVIPRGTHIVLSRKNGEIMWYGYGNIDGLSRSLLVLTSNLSLVRKGRKDHSPK